MNMNNEQCHDADNVISFRTRAAQHEQCHYALAPRPYARPGDPTRSVIESGDADSYTDPEVNRLWSLLRRLDPALLDNVQCFCKLTKHRTTPAPQLERAVYEKALMRMITALATVYEGLFPATALGLYERAAENYTQPLAGELHAKFIKPVTLDIIKRFRLTATKACSSAEKELTKIEPDTPDKYVSVIHAKLSLEVESSRTNPVDVITYFNRGHAQSPYFSTDAFRWYANHVQLADDSGPIPDSGDEAEVVLQGEAPAPTRAQKRKARREAAATAKKPHASPVLDLAAAGREKQREEWLANITHVFAGPFKQAWTDWYMHTANCTKEQVQCPYFVFTEYASCPAAAPCAKQFQHRTAVIENPSATQCEVFLSDFFRKHGGLPLDILTKLRPRWSQHLIQQALLPSTYATSKPTKTPRAPHHTTRNAGEGPRTSERAPHPGRKKRSGFS